MYIFFVFEVYCPFKLIQTHALFVTSATFNRRKMFEATAAVAFARAKLSLNVIFKNVKLQRDSNTQTSGCFQKGKKKKKFYYIIFMYDFCFSFILILSFSPWGTKQMLLADRLLTNM